jgi:hypothetical protein
VPITSAFGHKNSTAPITGAFGHKNSTAPITDAGVRTKVAIPKLRTFNTRDSFVSITPKSINAFTERGSEQVHKTNFFENKNMAKYQQNANASRNKSPELVVK